MVRIHALLTLVSGVLFGMSSSVMMSYTDDVSFWYYVPPVLVYLSALSIVFIRKGHSTDAFSAPSGPEAMLEFFYRSPAAIRRCMMASAVLSLGSFASAFFIVMAHNGDPNVAIFMLHMMLVALGYVILAAATVLDLSEDQDTMYGTS